MFASGLTPDHCTLGKAEVGLDLTAQGVLASSKLLSVAAPSGWAKTLFWWAHVASNPSLQIC